jgi:hypothetical protein
MEGRKDRGSYGAQKGRLDPNASTTNKEKARKKNPNMIKYRPDVMAKKYMSMKQKQVGYDNLCFMFIMYLLICKTKYKNEIWLFMKHLNYSNRRRSCNTSHTCATRRVVKSSICNCSGISLCIDVCGRVDVYCGNNNQDNWLKRSVM